MEHAMSSKSINQRDLCWDNINGFLISLVVFGHVLYAFQSDSTVDKIVDSIYFFHIPAFVFVSGYFSKRINSRSASSLVKLLSAYLLLTAVHLLMALVTGKELKITAPYYSAWYLLALIVWRLVTPYFSKLKQILPVLLAVLLLAGIWPDVNNSFGLSRIISLYPFFLAGYLLSEEKAAAIIRKPLQAKLLAGAGLLIAGGILAAVTKLFLHPEQRDFLFSAYEGSVLKQMLIRGMIFTVAALCILVLLFLTPNRKIPVLTKAGRNSLAIYLLHRPVTLVLNRFLTPFSTKAQMLAAVVFTLFALTVFGSDFISGLLDRILAFLADGFLGVRSETDRGRWKRVLAFALVFCILLAPVARLTARKIQNFKENSGQNTSSTDQTKDNSNRIKHPPIELTDEMRSGVLYTALMKAQNVCFVGDSITKGPSSNGGVPWYEPLESYVRGTVTNCGWGGATVQILLDHHMDSITGANADLFVIAIGTNDVMHRNPETCAMEPEIYIERMTSLRARILAANSEAQFVFIAPWYSTDGDGVGRQSFAEKLELYQQFAEALAAWAASNGDGFINANPYIQQTLELYPRSDYMVDYVHPNATAGVELYSRAALLYP